MITLEEDALQTTEVLSRDWIGTVHDAGAATDSALLATLNSRLHCRTPMKRMDREELAAREPVQLDGRRTTVRFETSPTPDEVATYRCLCGFTMDAPSITLEYAAAS
jgi:hypothetical protein